MALTGGIGTGKSYVRTRFADLGTPTIDADMLARRTVAPGTPGLNAVVRHFGTGILESGGGLDRAKLAAIVFGDPVSRLALEAIVHPAVHEATDQWFESLDPAQVPVAIADVPLLYEVGRDRDFDVVIVVACEPATQIRRVMERDHLTEEQVRQRLRAQWPIAEKVRRADYVIQTDGTFAETDRQVREIQARLTT